MKIDALLSLPHRSFSNILQKLLGFIPPVSLVIGPRSLGLSRSRSHVLNLRSQVTTSKTNPSSKSYPIHQFPCLSPSLSFKVVPSPKTKPRSKVPGLNSQALVLRSRIPWSQSWVFSLTSCKHHVQKAKQERKATSNIAEKNVMRSF